MGKTCGTVIAMNCSPTGKPLAASPQGIVSAGQPI